MYRGRRHMTLGPLEYVVIQFEGNRLTGEILPELKGIHGRGAVHLIDLVLIQKDANGKLTVHELSDLSEEELKPFGQITKGMLRLLSPEDIEDVSAELPNNSSAGLLLLEHVWAIDLREAIARAHGTLLDSGLIPQAQVEAAIADLPAPEVAYH